MGKVTVPREQQSSGPQSSAPGPEQGRRALPTEAQHPRGSGWPTLRPLTVTTSSPLEGFVANVITMKKDGIFQQDGFLYETVPHSVSFGQGKKVLGHGTQHFRGLDIWTS